MPLVHLIYRCPECGHDPTTHTERGAECRACGTAFERGNRAEIRVHTRGSEAHREATAAELIDVIDRWETEAPTGGPPGSFAWDAEVLARRAVSVGVTYERGGVAGFFEEFDEARPGTLRITDDGLTLVRGETFAWSWSAITAVQTASTSLQVNTRSDGLFDVRFTTDSPRRWEALLHRCLRAACARQGLRIREFQPRIVAVSE